MNKKKNIAKKNFIMSFISLVVCVAMFIGTTFAWFTDSVTSGTNQIVAGNLDIGLQYYDGQDWDNDVTTNVKLFNDSALWEPGHTEIAYLKITNNGTLHLKYKLTAKVNNEIPAVNVNGDPFNLSDYLKFGQVVTTSGMPTIYASDDAGRQSAISAVNDSATKLQDYTTATADLAPGASEYVTLVVYMPTTVGNEANYRGTAPSIEIGVNLVATQTTNETDAFDNQYDKDASYPTLAPVINSTDSEKVISGSPTVITSSIATSTVPSGIQIKNATNTGDSTVIENHDMADSSDLIRKIETTSSTSDSVTYDISYTYIETNGGTQQSYSVSEFGGVVENIITLSSGLENVSVTHSHGETVTVMTPTEDITTKADGTYYYDKDSGKLYIWSSKYSEYRISYASDFVATIDGQGFYSIMEALDSASAYDTVYVIKDSEMVLNDTSSDSDGADRSLWYDTENITLDFGGHTFTVKSNYGGSYNVLNVFGTGWTIKNGEIIVLRGENNEPDSYALGVEIKNGTITIENMTLHGGIALYDTVNATLKDTNCVMATNYYAVYLENGASATIKGGTYKANGDKPIVYANEQSDVIINDGTYIGTLKGGGGTITIHGGSFTDLASAINFAFDGITIKLAADASGMGIGSEDGDKTREELTIDFNGHTYTMMDPAVGSTGTETQAMHWGSSLGKVTMKNGTFNIVENPQQVYMGMQNYIDFTAENMTFDFRNIPQSYYGENEFSGSWAIFNGKECSIFNNTGQKLMKLIGCTVYMPEESKLGIYAGEYGTQMDDCVIHGAVNMQHLDSSTYLKTKNTTIEKGVVSYFGDAGTVNSTTEGDYTVYTISATSN